MNVQQLITFLQRFPGETPVLAADRLMPVQVPDQATALLDGDGDWQADLGEERTLGAEHGKRVTVVMLS